MDCGAAAESPMSNCEINTVPESNNNFSTSNTIGSAFKREVPGQFGAHRRLNFDYPRDWGTLHSSLLEIDRDESNCNEQSGSEARSFESSSPNFEFRTTALRDGDVSFKLLNASAFCDVPKSNSQGPRTAITDLRRKLTWRTIQRKYEMMMREGLNEKLNESEPDSCMRLVASINASLERSALVSNSSSSSAVVRSSEQDIVQSSDSQKLNLLHFWQQVNELHVWLDTFEARLADCNALDNGASRCERLIALDCLVGKQQEKMAFLDALRDSKRLLASTCASTVGSSSAQVEEQFEKLEARWLTLADRLRKCMTEGDQCDDLDDALLGDIESDVFAFSDWLHSIEQSHFVPFRDYVRTSVNLHELKIIAKSPGLGHERRAETASATATTAAASEPNLETMLETHQRLQNEIESRSRFITAVLKACDMFEHRSFLLQQADGGGRFSELCERLRTLKQSVAALEHVLHQKWLESLEFKFLIEQLLALADAGADADADAGAEPEAEAECQFQLELQEACASTPSAALHKRPRCSLVDAASADSGKCSCSQGQLSACEQCTRLSMSTSPDYRTTTNRYYLMTVADSDSDSACNKAALDNVETVVDRIAEAYGRSPANLSESAECKSTKELIDEVERLVSPRKSPSSQDDEFDRAEYVRKARVDDELLWDQFIVPPHGVARASDSDDSDARAREERFVHQIWDVDADSRAPDAADTCRSKRAFERRRAERHFELRMKAQIAAARKQRMSASASADSSPVKPDLLLLVSRSASVSTSANSTPRKRARRLRRSPARTKEIRRALFDQDTTTTCETNTEDGRANEPSESESLASRFVAKSVCSSERVWALQRTKLADTVMQHAESAAQVRQEQISEIRTTLDQISGAGQLQLTALLQQQSAKHTHEQVLRWRRLSTDTSQLSQSAAQFTSVLQSSRSLLNSLADCCTSPEHTCQLAASLADSVRSLNSDLLNWSPDAEPVAHFSPSPNCDSLDPNLQSQIRRTLQSVIAALNSDRLNNKFADDELLGATQSQLRRLLLAEFTDLYASLAVTRERLLSRAQDSFGLRENAHASTDTDTSQQCQDECTEADLCDSVGLNSGPSAAGGRTWRRRYFWTCLLLLLFSCVLLGVIVSDSSSLADAGNNSCEFSAMRSLRDRLHSPSRSPPV